ncbi:MAG: hypothetical protein ACR2PA_03885 [Hyphomicrobiaceae bacterium]
MRVIVSCVISILTLLFTPDAQAIGLTGKWSGEGTAKLPSGKTERFWCRVTYDAVSAKVFGVRAICASPSIKIIQSGQVLQVRPNTYVGEFRNDSYDIGARVRVVVHGQRQSVMLSAGHGTGRLELLKR